MFKPLIAVLGLSLCFCPILATADDTKICNSNQQGRCENFCKAHQGVHSCIIDITTVSGTCSCNDGTNHTKS